MKASELLNISSNKSIFRELVLDCMDRNIVPFIGAGMSASIFPLWKTALLNVSRKSMDPDFLTIVKESLDNYQYEEAASCIYQEIGEGEFYGGFVEVFSNDKIRNFKSMAVNVLPKIFQGLVITTNFDKLLETVYEQAECKFEDFSHYLTENGIKTDQYIKGIAKNEHYLFKVHGDIDQPHTLILTEEDYDKIYGMDTPYKQALMQIFKTKQLLFLGCSLGNDRIMDLYKEAKRTDKIYGYAFVQKPNDRKKAQKRMRELSNMLIRPIWYPEDDTKHESVKVLLKFLYSQIEKEKKKNLENNNQTLKKK